MKNIAIAIAIAFGTLMALAMPVFAQTFEDRLAALEKNMVVKSDLDPIKKDIADIKAFLMIPKTDPFATSSAVQPPKMAATCPGCACGCAVTGVCTCATMTTAANAAPQVIGYKTVCANGVCSYVPVTASGGATYTYSDVSDTGASNSQTRIGGGTGPIRRIIHAIFPKLGNRKGGAACGN